MCRLHPSAACPLMQQGVILFRRRKRSRAEGLGVSVGVGTALQPRTASSSLSMPVNKLTALLQLCTTPLSSSRFHPTAWKCRSLFAEEELFAEESSWGLFWAPVGGWWKSSKAFGESICFLEPCESKQHLKYTASI